MVKYVTPDGKTNISVIDASSPERAKNSVQIEDILVLDVKETSSWLKDGFFKVKAKDLALFCHQMENVTTAGVPLLEALIMITKTQKNKRLRFALKGVTEFVQAGRTMSEAMKIYDKVFPDVMVQMVRAGEESGQISDIFARLAIQYDHISQIKNEIKRSLAYPKMVILVSIIAIIIVCAKIIPQFVGVFNEMGTELPAPTKFFIALSDFFTSKWYILLISAIIVFGGWFLFKRSEGGSKFIDKVRIKIPYLKDFEAQQAGSSFARTMSTLIHAGLNYTDALNITAETMENHIYKEKIFEMKKDIEKGTDFSKAVITQNAFPEPLNQLIKIGEKSGNIEDMLDNAADYFEDEVKTTTMQLVSAINPIILIVLGIFIGMLVYAIYSPIFSVYQGIK